MTFLYVIAAEKASKIGISMVPARRLKLLQLQTTETLRLGDTFKFDCMKDAREVESQCHLALQPYRLAGTEWFECEPEQCAALARNMSEAFSSAPSVEEEEEVEASLGFDTKANKAWGAAVKAARAQTNVTQQEMANRLNVPQQVISKIETGLRPLKAAEITVIAKACRMTPKALFNVFLALYQG